MKLLSKSNWQKLLNICLLFLTISSVVQWLTIPVGSTTIWWTIQSVVLISLFNLTPKRYAPWPLALWIVVIVSGLIYGVFVAEDYWDWKLLIQNALAFLLCYSSIVYANPKIGFISLRFWYKYAWILIALLIPFVRSDGVAKLLVPYSFVALFLCSVRKKMKLIIILAFLLTVILGSDSRSDMLKFLICLFLGLMTCSRWTIRRLCKISKIVRTVFLIAPFILLLLGVTSKFNVFNIDEELNIDGSLVIKQQSGESVSALDDTRTFLYEEVLQSVVSNNALLFGVSPAHGYTSDWYTRHDSTDRGINHYGIRDHSEVSILNIFNYWGIIGVIAYFLVFFISSYLAVYKSNNNYLPIVGMYVSFRWLFGFIEDFSLFDLNMLFLWIMIGMCFSPVFRSMSNREFSKWVSRITF